MEFSRAGARPARRGGFLRSLRASGLVHLKSPFGLRVAAAAAAAVAAEGEVGADGVVFSILHHSKHGHQLRTKTFQPKIERIVFSLTTKFFAFLAIVVFIAATPFQMTQIK